MTHLATPRVSRWRVLSAAMVAPLALLLLHGPPVSADCGSQPVPPEVIGVAFTGTVVSVNEVDPGTYAVAIDVERRLAGGSGDLVTFETGDYADCHMIDGSRFRAGDELAVIGTRWIDDRSLLHSLAWRRQADGSWGLGLVATTNRRRLPADLRAIHSLPEIANLVRGRLPATDASAGTSGPVDPLPLVAAALAGLLFLITRIRREPAVEEAP